MRYDATLKKLFQRPPNRLLSYALGHPVVVQRSLPTEQIRIDKLQPDLLLETEDGRILHVELQGYPLDDFPCRNLLYFGLVLRDHGQGPEQIVFWTGINKVGVEEGLHFPKQLDYRYTVIDVRQLDPDFLLDGDEPSEWVFAILCRLREPEHDIARILRRLATRPVNEQREAILQLLILSGLRGLQPVVEQEVSRMPISIDIHENEFLEDIYQQGEKQGIERGIEKGIEHAQRLAREQSSELLLQMLRAKYATIPAEIEARVASADSPDLHKWMLRVVHSTSLDEVFAA